MRHPPPATLHAHVDGSIERPRRLLMEAHLALCSICSRVVADCCDADVDLPEAKIWGELELPAFDRVWAAVEPVTAARQFPAVAVLPPMLPTALPDPAEWR